MYEVATVAGEKGQRGVVLLLYLVMFRYAVMEN